MSVDAVVQILAGFRAKRGSRGEIHLDCPECVKRTGRPDKKRHLGINVEKRVANCFRCGYASRDIGSAAKFLFGPELGAEVARVVGRRAATSAEEMFTGPAEKRAASEKMLPWEPLRSPSSTVAVLDDDASIALEERAQAFRLLAGKGLDRDEVQYYGFRAVAGCARPTVMIPVEAEDGSLVYYYFRDDRGRYTYLSEEAETTLGKATFPAVPGKGQGQFVTGLAWNRWKRREVYVVEGIFDALGVNRFFRWGVALGTKHVTEEKAKRIAALRVGKIIVTLDGKADVTREDIFKAPDTIATHAGRERVYVLKLPAGDPGDWLRERRPNVDLDAIEPYMAAITRRGL